MSNLRNNDFEQYKRTNPDVKELATVWRGSDEDQSWRSIYLTQDDDIVQYIENEQVVTFYRNLTEDEKNRATVAAEKEAVAVAEENTGYQELEVVHEHSNDEQTHIVTWVKLGTPRKVNIGDRWAEVEYVLVDQVRDYVELDGQKPFQSYETVVFVSDNEKTNYTETMGATPIYIAPSWVEVWEAMWALGEIQVKDKESN